MDEQLAIRGLNNDAPHVRAWTIQLATEDPSSATSPKVQERLASMADDDSSVVRLYLASAMQRVSLAERRATLTKLLSHSEDAADHNLPLMLWYAAEPLAESNPGEALRLAADGKIPLVFSFMVRRIAKRLAFTCTRAWLSCFQALSGNTKR